MKGGSQSILVQCDDNRFYVVKMAGNPQGSKLLANECLGSVIAHAVGLPVAECRVIRLSDHFIDSDPESVVRTLLWQEAPRGRLAFWKLAPGPAFVVLNGRQNTLIVPGSTQLRIVTHF
jgi:hypothetical protein